MKDKQKQSRPAPRVPSGLMPNARLYLIFLVIFAIATLILVRDRWWIAAAEGGVIIALIVYSLILRRSKRKALLRYLESVTYDTESAMNNTLQNFPLPIATFYMRGLQLVWANQHFFDLCGRRKPSVELSMTDLLPSFSARWLLEGQSQAPELLEHNGRKYRIHGNLMKPEGTEATSPMGITYWIDVTDYETTRQEYLDSRPNVAIFVIDNYDELIRNQTERMRNDLRDSIEDILTQWCESRHALLRRFERQKYLCVFEERYLEEIRKARFADVLEAAHGVVSPSGIRATLSIGVGHEGESFAENTTFAGLGVEMALSRGGDQAVIKNRVSFEFFGGRGSTIETRTRVKSRVMANALGQLIADSSNVYVMGHRMSDFDAIGAAAGVACIARAQGKPCRIVVDETKTAARPLLEKLRALSSYEDVFYTPQEAILHADSQTLLVVVDTNRPGQVEDRALLESCTRVALIDHHRRAADYIQTVTMAFHDPHASSTCELVCELVEELVEQKDFLRVEAEALLSGIMLDTKNFTIRTGERTFEAAAFLRRSGADTAEVKKLLQSDMTNTVARYRILQNARIDRPGVAIAVQAEQQDRIVAAKAADELLNVAGVSCSLVVYPVPDGVFVSARSIGEINVQLLLEPFGGGGNRAAAAVQMHDVTLQEAISRLESALDEYEAD